MAKTQVSLRDGYMTTIKTRHHVYHADEPTDAGGTDAAVTPMEMAIGALGSCIVITMKLYAERKNWPLEGVDIELDFDRFSARDYPLYDGDAKFVHEIREAIVLHGDLTDEQRERILEIGSKCPVHRLIDLPTFWKSELVADLLEEGDVLPE